MPARIEITCITKTEHFAAHRRISNIGGTNFAGRRWTMSQDGAIKGIEDGKYAFYVNVRARVTNVIVATSESGHKYLKTFADHEVPDSLLSLPPCPDQ